MDSEQLIPADEFCSHYNVELSFIQTLEEFGLIQVTTMQEKGFVAADQLKDLEQYIRLHYDLGINAEGIDAIANILQRVKDLQHEIALMRNRLHLYESRQQALE